MSRLFTDNAFNILGLETSTSQKELIKQSKKIIVFINNEEDFESELDLSSINPVSRTEASVNDALQRLNSPIKRIKEYFFWFEIENDDDENNIKLLQDNQYDEAIDNWKNRADKSFTAKRNLAITSSILLNHTGYKKYLNQSIEYWKDIVNSDKFWSHFEKVYELNDEIGTSKSAINDFRDNILDQLSDFYSDISRSKKDNSIYAAFNTAFGIKGQKVQDEILTPIFEKINDASEQLRLLNASQDNVLSSQESMAIKRLVKKIQDSFQEIKEIGLYEDSSSKVMRDKAADAINVVAVDLFNNLDEDDKAIALLKFAKSFAHGPKVLSQIKENYDYIKRVTSHKKLIEPINDLIENEQYEEALELINEEIDKNKKDETLQLYFKKRTQWCVTALANRDFKAAERLFEEKNFTNAEYWFNSIYEFIYSYIQHFDIDQDALDNVLVTLNNKLAYLNPNNINDVSNYRQQVIENSNFDKEQMFEVPILSMLLDSLIYLNMAQQLPKIIQKNKVQRIKNFAWNIVVWGVIIGGAALFFGSGSSDSNTSTGSSSSSSSAFQTCMSEYNSLKSQLDIVESQMNSYSSSGDVESYNYLVPRQNALASQVNNKATECNNLR
jgi:hypothetical protein